MATVVCSRLGVGGAVVLLRSAGCSAGPSYLTKEL